MPYLLIDAHEDLAYSALTFNRNYLKSADETRVIERNSEIPEIAGDCCLGWPDWQKGKVAIIFSTFFILPHQYRSGNWEGVSYRSIDEAEKLLHKQLSYYQRLEGQNSDKFRIIHSSDDLNTIWKNWKKAPDQENTIGLVLLMEGAEGLGNIKSLEEWYDAGLRIVGPVWAGTRYCGGSYEGEGFTDEGRRLLEVMADMKFGLDLSHMTEQSTLEALDRYEGVVFATHANSRKLLKGAYGERNFTDDTIRRLAEREGVIGVLPLNRFLVPDWTNSSPRDKVSLNHLVDHIDYICQLTGSSQHVAIGTDFDGGFGYPAIPGELNSIAEIQTLATILESRGYLSDDIEAIFGLNWKRILERILSA